MLHNAVAGSTGKRTAGERQVKVIHSFCVRKSCLDGDDLSGSLTRDASGNFYGTTFQGGISTFGTVFELVKDGNKHWKRVTLYQFCQQEKCTDGRSPIAPPIIDTAGNLIGTTFWGGLEDDEPNHNGHGIIYKLTPNADKTRWTFKVLHTFCANGTCADGAQPSVAFTYQGSAQGLPYDGVSPLYLPTEMGGAHDDGAVIEFVPKAGTDHWQESVLYDFCSRGGANCMDGAFPGPNALLLMDKSGNLFGTTTNGGQTIYGGVVFELTNTGRHRWSETVVHRFTLGTPAWHDGSSPVSGVVWGPDGDLFGTTFEGGSSAGRGVLYKLTPNGGKWKYRVLHSFCQGGGHCPDGAAPRGGLLVDDAGNIFGTTSSGGNGYDIYGTGGGLIFELKKSFKILHLFCSAVGDCSDGEYPHADLMRDSAGHIFGSTELGGEYFGGAVFQFKP